MKKDKGKKNNNIYLYIWIIIFWLQDIFDMLITVLTNIFHPTCNRFSQKFLLYWGEVEEFGDMADREGGGGNQKGNMVKMWLHKYKWSIRGAS